VAPLVEAVAPLVEAGAPLVEAGAAPVEAVAPLVEAGPAPVDSIAPPVEAVTPPVESVTPLDSSTRARVERLIAEMQSNLTELRAIVMEGAPPADSGAPPADSGVPPVESEVPPVESEAPPVQAVMPPVESVAPPVQAVAAPREAPRVSQADPNPVDGAWSLQPPRFMGRIPTSARYLPLAIAIPAVLVSLLVLTASVLKDGPALPRGDILFEHFVGHGWVDIFTLSLVGVAGLLAATGLRRFWKGLHATLPPGLPLRPLSDALRETAGEVLAHDDFHDWTTSDVRRGSHLAMFYGFLGLMAATTGAALYTEIFPILGIDWHHNTLSLPIWDPVKIIGNAGGIALLIGLAQTLSIWLRRPRTAGESTYSDWFFPGSLVLTAVTGFLTEILRFAGVRLAYVAYAVHLVFVFALFVFFPFSKFAHVIYHPAARTFGRRLRKRKPASTLAPRAT
jgi:quinone-modifying oxidoreductase subunit QmoC